MKKVSLEQWLGCNFEERKTLGKRHLWVKIENSKEVAVFKRYRTTTSKPRREASEEGESLLCVFSVAFAQQQVCLSIRLRVVVGKRKFQKTTTTAIKSKSLLTHEKVLPSNFVRSFLILNSKKSPFLPYPAYLAPNMFSSPKRCAAWNLWRRTWG